MTTLESIRDQIEPPIAAIPELHRNWFVCEVYSKAEFKAESALQALGFDAYTPRSRHFRKSAFSARRRQKIDRPLFPGYCFVGFDLEREEWWRPIHEADGIKSVLMNNLIPVAVHKAAVEQIKRAEEVGLFDRTIPSSNFREGQMVEIMAGPMAGLIAKVKNARAKKRIQIILGSLMVEVDSYNLAKAI